MTVLERLKKLLKKYTGSGIALAFSGGVDSAFLLAVLKAMHDEKSFRLKLFFMRSAFQRKEDAVHAVRLATEARVPLEIFDFYPLSIPAIRNNAIDRCYHCKKRFFSTFVKVAAGQGLGTVMDGTNGDDLTKYRPGRKACVELGIVSPLAMLGITKKSIRRMAKAMNLEFASRPASPCLATRFPYGTRLDAESLEKAAEGEKIIRSCLPETSDVRLRVDGASARIEVTEKDSGKVFSSRRKLTKLLHGLGYEFVSLDLDGFRSGSFDRGASKRK